MTTSSTKWQIFTILFFFFNYITLDFCKILASSWMFAHRFPITFLSFWSKHPYYDIRRYVHSNVLILFLVCFCCFTTRFPVKNLKAHIWRALTGSDAKISRKGQCLSTSPQLPFSCRREKSHEIDHILISYVTGNLVVSIP